MALRAIWQFMERSVTPEILYGNKLPFGTKCHELFVILYTTDQNYFYQFDALYGHSQYKY